MLIWGMLLAVAALVCWPDTRSLRRIRSSTRRASRPAKRATGVLRRIPLLLLAPAVAISLGTVGVAGTIGLAMLGAALHQQYREHARSKARFVAGRDLAEALRTLVVELRAGTHPAAAAESAAAEAGADTARVLRTVAATARLGGEPETVRIPTSAVTSGTGPVSQISRSWALAQRHGLPFADVLDALREDVEVRARLAAKAHADMAGPRASALVLALLPAAGLALGEVMGAAPLRVLGSTPTGQLLLGAGCGLIALGLLFSARLTCTGVGS